MDKPQAEDFRARLKVLIDELGGHRARIHNEINQNIELAYRHLEDASLRLLKARIAMGDADETKEAAE